MISADLKSLTDWAESELDSDLQNWVKSQVSKIETNPKLHFYTSLSLTARKTSSPLTNTPIIKLNNEYVWHAKGWNQRTLIRAIFCLTALNEQGDPLIETAFNTADLNESIDLYQILPLFKVSPEQTLRASEGLRSNATVVFKSVAHHSPLPLNLEEPAWNQMILKSLFIDSALSPILGLEDRWNKDLSDMLSDYAEERISARRPVPLELWRCISPYLSDRHRDMIQTEWSFNETKAQSALYLCLKDSKLKWAQELITSYKTPTSQPNWESLCPT